MSDAILCRIENHVATLTLSAPERHNALSLEDLLALESYCAQLSQDDNVRVLVLTGTGEKTFCAGAFLGDVPAGLRDGNRFQQMVDKVEDFPKPTICSLNGSVYGGGVELALACDFRIGITGTKMFVPPAKLGLCYPYNGLTRFVSRLGITLSKRLLLANETFSAEQMLDFGIIDHLVAPAERGPLTLALASKMCELAPLSLQAMKQTVNEIARGEGSAEKSLPRELMCMHSDDLKEGLRAQKEKRPAVFSGK